MAELWQSQKIKKIFFRQRIGVQAETEMPSLIQNILHFWLAWMLKRQKKDKSNEDIENKMQKICNKSNNYMLSQKSQGS